MSEWFNDAFSKFSKVSSVTWIALSVVAVLGLIVGVKLVLHPLVVGLIVCSLPGLAPEMRAAAIVFASMPVFSIYPLLGVAYGMERFCSAAVVVATLLEAGADRAVTYKNDSRGQKLNYDVVGKAVLRMRTCVETMSASWKDEIEEDVRTRGR